MTIMTTTATKHYQILCSYVHSYVIYVHEQCQNHILQLHYTIHYIQQLLYLSLLIMVISFQHNSTMKNTKTTTFYTIIISAYITTSISISIQHYQRNKKIINALKIKYKDTIFIICMMKMYGYVFQYSDFVNSPNVLNIT